MSRHGRRELRRGSRSRRKKNPSHERQKEKQEVIEQQKAKREAAANSFEAVARECMERQQERWSRSHARAILGTLERDAFPFIGDCPVDAVTPPMVLEAVRSIDDYFINSSWRSLEFNEDIYSKVRQTIIEKLGDRSKYYIGNISILKNP